MAEVRHAINSVKKSEEELPYRAQKTIEYLENFTKLTKKDLKAMLEEVERLDIPRFKPGHLAKVIDLMPTDIEELKSLFSGEAITIKQEDMKKIVSVLDKFR